MKNIALLVILAAASSGCMEHQLRDKSIKLTTTTTDLFFMQVLDNVARTIDNPSEMPYFDVPALAPFKSKGRFQQRIPRNGHLSQLRTPFDLAVGS
jgi:hypothetical protein